MQLVDFPDSSTRLDSFVFQCIEMRSLQHPEVSFGVVIGLWAGQLRIHGSTVSCSVTRHIGTQPEHICFLLTAVFFSIFLQIISTLQN
jgi:hypothetical protein